MPSQRAHVTFGRAKSSLAMAVFSALGLGGCNPPHGEEAQIVVSAPAVQVQSLGEPQPLNRASSFPFTPPASTVYTLTFDATLIAAAPLNNFAHVELTLPSACASAGDVYASANADYLPWHRYMTARIEREAVDLQKAFYSQQLSDADLQNCASVLHRIYRSTVSTAGRSPRGFQWADNVIVNPTGAPGSEFRRTRPDVPAGIGDVKPSRVVTIIEGMDLIHGATGSAFLSATGCTPYIAIGSPLIAATGCTMIPATGSTLISATAGGQLFAWDSGYLRAEVRDNAIDGWSATNGSPLRGARIVPSSSIHRLQWNSATCHWMPDSSDDAVVTVYYKEDRYYFQDHGGPILCGTLKSIASSALSRDAVDAIDQGGSRGLGANTINVPQAHNRRIDKRSAAALSRLWGGHWDVGYAHQLRNDFASLLYLVVEDRYAELLAACSTNSTTGCLDFDVEPRHLGEYIVPALKPADLAKNPDALAPYQRDFHARVLLVAQKYLKQADCVRKPFVRGVGPRDVAQSNGAPLQVMPYCTNPGNNASARAVTGWILLPPSADRQPPGATASARYSLQASVVVPAWQHTLEITEKTWWGTGDNPQNLRTSTMIVELPPDFASLTAAFLGDAAR